MSYSFSTIVPTALFLPFQLTPTFLVVDASTWKHTPACQAISTGRDHACGITVDRKVLCWGSNSYGKATVPGGSGADGSEWLYVSTGQGHTCGIRVDRKAECWGNNGNGEATVPGGSGAEGSEWLQISTGHSHTCGIRVDRKAVCWG